MEGKFNEKTLLIRGLYFALAINITVVASVYFLVITLFGFTGENVHKFTLTFLVIIIIFEVLSIAIVQVLNRPMRQFFRLKEAGEKVPQEIIEKLWNLFTTSPVRLAAIGLIAPVALSGVMSLVLRAFDAITGLQVLYGIGLGFWAGAFISVCFYTFTKDMWEDLSSSFPELAEMGWAGPKLGISLKLILFSVCLTAIPAILIGMISYQQASASFERSSYDYLKQEVRLIAQTSKWVLDAGSDEMILENMLSNTVRIGVPILLNTSSMTTIVGEISGVSDIVIERAKAGDVEVTTSSNRIIAITRVEGHDYLVGLSESRAKLQSELGRLRIIISLVTIGAFIAAVALAIFFARGFTRPLRRLLKRVEAVGRGELSLKGSVPGDDEIDDLNKGVETMTRSLSEMVGSLGEASTSIMKATDEIANSLANVTEGSKAQAYAVSNTLSSMEVVDKGGKQVQESLQNLVSSTTESGSTVATTTSSVEDIAKITVSLTDTISDVSSSIQEMAQSIKRVAENAETLSTVTEESASSMIEMDATIKEVEKRAEETTNLADKVNIDAKAGAHAVATTVTGIEAIKTSFNQVDNVIKSLAEQSTKIDQMLNVIAHVAEETNLLALNAAILAAQAGARGRGFSVVAEEIKALAERTGNSTKDIAEVIKGLKKQASNARLAMDEGMTAVMEAVELSQKAGMALEQIEKSSTEASQMVQGISRITSEQAMGSMTVTKSVAKVSEMAGQINMSMKEQADGSEQVRDATQKMNVISERLKDTTREQFQSMKQLTTSIEDIRSRAQDIAAAQSQQKAGEDTVLEATHHIKDIAEECMEAVNKVESAITDLAVQSQNLENAMGRFKV